MRHEQPEMALPFLPACKIHPACKTRVLPGVRVHVVVSSHASYIWKRGCHNRLRRVLLIISLHWESLLR